MHASTCISILICQRRSYIYTYINENNTNTQLWGLGWGLWSPSCWDPHWWDPRWWSDVHHLELQDCNNLPPPFECWTLCNRCWHNHWLVSNTLSKKYIFLEPSLYSQHTTSAPSALVQHIDKYASYVKASQDRSQQQHEQQNQVYKILIKQHN